MIDVKKCNDNELEDLGVLLIDKNLQTEVKEELVKRHSKSVAIAQYQFQSEQLPNFKEENKELCQSILSEIDIKKFGFLTMSFLDAKNNLGGYFFPERYNIKNCLFNDDKVNLNDLLELFEDKVIQGNFEGTYNMINYIVNSVYRNIEAYDGELTKDILFEELPIRKLIVKEKFSEIVSSLWEIRENIPGARICIGNAGLTRNKNASLKYATLTQTELVNSIAFGCSYDELTQGNYEGAKKLIYVPRQNLNK